MAWQLLQRDSLGVMREMADRSVDHVIADYPYDEKTHVGALVQHNGSTQQIDFAALVHMAHVTEALRIARRWVLMFCALEQLGDYKAAAGERWVRAGLWVRHSGPQKTGDRPGQGGEGIAIMHAAKSGRMEWNGGGKAGVWQYPIATDKVHPCQKPDALMDALIVDFTEYGDTIFDGAAGSCATGVAAIRRGRNFIGCEDNPAHYETGRSRLEAAREQGQIFQKKKKAKQIDFLKHQSQDATGGHDEDQDNEVQGAQGGRQDAAGEDVQAG